MFTRWHLSATAETVSKVTETFRKSTPNENELNTQATNFLGDFIAEHRETSVENDKISLHTNNHKVHQ